MREERSGIGEGPDGRTRGVDADAADAPFRGIVRYGFRAGAMPLLFDPTTATRILEVPALFPLPNAAPWCRGLANVDGTLVPVFDLAEALGDAPSAREQRKLLVMGARERAAALLVDATPVRIEIDPDTEVLPGDLPALLEPHLNTAYRMEGIQWLDVDYPELFHALSRAASG